MQTGKVSTDLLAEARRLVAAKISLLPIATDGTKSPDGRVLPYDEQEKRTVWKPYQQRLPTEAELRRWFGNGHRRGVAIVAGAVSGNLEDIDFDDADLFFAWREIVKQIQPELLSRLVLIKTPRPGFSVWYRSQEPVPGNLKLARGERADPITGEIKVKTLIETRGEGGYAVIPPSPPECHETKRPYALIHGDLGNLPLLTTDERDLLISSAQALNEHVEPEKAVRPANAPGDGNRPGDEYNSRASWSELLERHGWTFVQQRGDAQYWRRPGKERGISASLGHVAPGFLYVFSTNAYPFESEHSYSLFTAYCYLEHNKDFGAAGKALYAAGYGARLEERSEPPLLISERPGGTDLDGRTLPPLRTDFRLTDEGNAERLVYYYGSEMRYCFEKGEWLLWNGKHWQPDKTSQAEHLVVNVARVILKQSADEPEKDLKNQLIRHSKDMESRRGIAACLELARKHVAVRPDDLDRDPLLINTQDGTFDVRTGQCRQHQKDDLISCITVAGYSPDAQDDRLDAFLRDVSENDPELLAFLQRSAGYSATGETGAKALFLVIGPPDTGKTTFFEAFAYNLGSYARNADFETFIARKEVGSPRPDIARLAGARFVYAVETDAGQALASGKVKLLSGGDTITARFLHAKEFEFAARFKLWLGANDAPHLRHSDEALWSRIQRIPFLHQPEKKDRTLPAHLRDPQGAAPAFLRWVLEGAVQWHRSGLGTSAAVDRARAEYRSEMDPFAEFFSDHCRFEPRVKVYSGTLWEEYLLRTPATHRGTRKEMASALEARGCEADRTTGGVRLWKGVCLAVSAPGDPRLFD